MSNHNTLKLEKYKPDPLLGSPQWSRMTWQEGRQYIRRRLQETGTDVELNDRDKYGDGDQSKVDSEKAQFYRDLYAQGGDINLLIDDRLSPLTDFQKYCIYGSVKQVKSVLDWASKQGPDTLMKLLESRETAMRQSALMMVVSIGKNVCPPSQDARKEMEKNHVAVAKLLLQYGVRPDVRDVCGKTVCHYGMGCMATLNMTVKICEMCAEAWKSHYMFGKKVELHGLVNKAELNGRTGICKGYLVDSDRRIIELEGDNKTLSIKPVNLKLCDVTDDNDPSIDVPRLFDIPDRFGTVCLSEVIIQDRKDIADLLLHKFHARTDIADCDGMSPAKMSINTAAVSQTSGMVNQAGGLAARAQKKVERRTCDNCGKIKKKETKLMDCSICQSVAYCSKECQGTGKKRTIFLV